MEEVRREKLDELFPIDAEMGELLKESKPQSEIPEGEIVKGRIIKVDGKDVIVDVGLKSEGLLPLSEFHEPDEVKPGMEIDVFLESKENDQGFAVLSKQKADFLKVWDDIKKSYNEAVPVEGKILRRVKGGMIVSIFGVEAFLPGSQIDLHPVKDMDALIGTKMDFRIIKLNWKRRNIVVSRRIILEEERNRKKNEMFEKINEGDILEGTVKNITKFGAFIDLGGLDGLLHISDITWGNILHPAEVLKIGDKVKVVVTKIDRDKQRISLGMKQLSPYPWKDIDKKYPVGKKVSGKVVSITEYGAFVELEKGIEGLIHISEMSWNKHVKHPSSILNIGDEVEAVVLKVDPQQERISLGLKQAQKDPWEELAERYPEGTIVEGKVVNIVNYGAFVEIEDGVDGLIHISDFSWTKRIKHPSEMVKKGDVIKCKVLNVDKEKKRISLGIKQMVDPYEVAKEKYPEGTVVKGKVIEIIPGKGLVLQLDDIVTAFMPLSQIMPDETGKKNLNAFKIDDEIEGIVYEINKKSRRAIMSQRKLYEENPENTETTEESEENKEEKSEE